MITHGSSGTSGSSSASSSTSGLAGQWTLPSVRCVPADATGSVNLSDNQAVRLIHRERPREDSLEEGECYDHSYREHVSDHVELVRLAPE
jgi:hypothetical protein